ncbi:hypothetical protein M011DRAFT_247483 [Sporormia fimetaria CBS 119925]|uniref:Uncharacterized protein n=1 Tax=Sporormia fimetaria CBS 119925 TaxID=1340428 RepID=A0A6A6V1P3_9PLEO|nr:hypothetical protein M011DRAFT_247483 [Sporormia fimetaria CBS 119925]
MGNCISGIGKIWDDIHTIPYDSLSSPQPILTQPEEPPEIPPSQRRPSLSSHPNIPSQPVPIPGAQPRLRPLQPREERPVCRHARCPRTECRKTAK